MSTLAKVLEAKIKNAKSEEKESIRKKLDVFYAADRIIDDEYTHLVSMLDRGKELELESATENPDEEISGDGNLIDSGAGDPE